MCSRGSSCSAGCPTAQPTRKWSKPAPRIPLPAARPSRSRTRTAHTRSPASTATIRCQWSCASPGLASSAAFRRSPLAPLPFRWKERALKVLRRGRDPHQSFDTFSPLINDTYEHETVEGWLHELGFPDVVRTIDYTELYLRARRTEGHPLLPRPKRPYWFERYRRRPLPPPPE